ncbi:MAG TPA: NUDIX hydrolase [Corynebacterium flavescens]|nr:NUDIX hydrolase [Corynebacterium flavescens]
MKAMDYSAFSATERRTLPPLVAVSAVAFALRPPAEARVAELSVGQGETGESGESGTTLWLPLVRRLRPPFSGVWALPGGPLRFDETLSGAAERTLLSTVGRGPAYLEQLYSFGGVERSGNAQRLVTIAYWAQYGRHELAQPAVGPVDNVEWFSADNLPELAFDHADIVDYALWRLRMKTGYATVAHRFLGPVFTLAQLRGVHEAILGHRVDPANFRRQTLAQGYLVDTGQTETGAKHRPATLYRLRE